MNPILEKTLTMIKQMKAEGYSNDRIIIFIDTFIDSMILMMDNEVDMVALNCYRIIAKLELDKC